LGSARLLGFISRVYPSIEAHLNRGTTLEELLANNQQIEVNVLKVIHYFNIQGIITFKDVLKSSNLSHKLKRLQKLHNELDKKNYFERLGVSRSAKDSDIKKAYFDLAKVLHPDKLSSQTPEKVVELSEKVFEKIQVAYDTLKKQDKKETYLKELEVGQAERLLQADHHLEIGRNFLLKGQYSQAKTELIKARDYNPDSPDTRVLLVWAEIKMAKQTTDNFCLEIEKKLNQVPLESRDSAAYYHTRGLFCVMINDNDKARKYFHTALNMDQTFINSRRELSQLGSKKEPVNILTADLKDVVGMIFSKKR
ncbi:MAG: DnaJ domain-containing protein, partial [Bdellovibrionales bacterium]|nr:DnaJ domain-containing protein [Bdellovibrionales bacterium]NQZ19072.1 DnaJ domain-containing protein [Bdellovibrionales bacterium]